MDEQGLRMKNRLESIIATGRENMGSTYEDIAREHQIRQDFFASTVGRGQVDTIQDWDIQPYPQNAKKISYDPIDFVKPVFAEHGTMKLTNHSYAQMVQRFQIPSAYVDSLLELGEADLLKDNFKRMYERRMESGALIRSVGSTAKGWLSTSYKRFNSMPIMESFIGAVTEMGFMPVQAYNTDYRYFLGFVLPDVFEIGEREYVTYGVSMATGDYGSSALTLGLLVLRVQCTNLAIGSSILRKVHIGSRVDVNDERMHLMLSQETVTKDTDAMASYVRDITRASGDEIKALNGKVKQAVITPVDMKQELEGIKKKFGKGLAEQVDTLWKQDIEDLPSGDNKWRLSNVLSLIANGKDVKADNKMDLQKEACRIIESLKTA
jgi:hypothetical protein